LCIVAAALAACSRGPAAPPRAAPAPAIRHVLFITIDTLRADHVGAYGYAAARTPALDRVAREGVVFERAYATAPITLTSHASLMTGRYPPGHGARHNGMRLDPGTPTLAERFSAAGYTTAAFVAAFPLDRRFGLIKGFHAYGDTMPRDANGRVTNERPGRLVVDEALAWLGAHRQEKIFLWVHLFEPHAPYGRPGGQGSTIARYDDDVAEADAQAARLLDALGDLRASTLLVIAGDHGEAFGEHGEISHSIFTYDTTLRVPLVVSGPGLAGGTHVPDAVSLVDVAPTVASLAGLGPFDADGIVVLPPKGGSYRSGAGAEGGTRSLYAESFAPLLDFGWSPLRTLRSGGWKFIAAPSPELYDLSSDPGETRNLAQEQPARVAQLARQVDAISLATLPAAGVASDAATASAKTDRETVARLQALGYASGRPGTTGDRPDPKDRRDVAAQFARVASGELQGAALERGLRDILRVDPANPQANVRLGYLLFESGRCAEAVPRFTAAIAAHLPGADAHLGRAACEASARNVAAAERTLTDAQRVEPDNPVVSANLGLLLSDSGRPAAGIPHLQRALSLDPDLHQARFGLAIAYARTAQRPEAAREAQELLRRLPPDAPQRPEVERLLAAVR
jgi:arylsulfatase A-like enzyme/cytochrome c-type biogenesis protein CcmH/NrfG